MKPAILYTKPSITELETSYATDAARNGWGSRCYEYIHEFEERFKSYLGVKYALATSSCTGALHMGLAALGIGPGDEVIIADTNWIASAAPIAYLGAKPVFVDILPDSWCINPKLAERAINSRTKAIIAVHLYGNLCTMDELLEIGKRHGIPVIEDAAEAIGSTYQGKHAGGIGKFGCFSFHGTKTITTGEGGMLVTDDPDLYEMIYTLSNHGRTRGQSKQFCPEVLGFKYKMSNIQAAIGCAQLERIETLVARKREIFLYYHNHLSNLPGVKMNPENDGDVNGYWMPTIVFEPKLGITCDRILKSFARENIDGRNFFSPLSSLLMFSPAPENHLSYDLPQRAINLPSYHDMTKDELDRVIGAINDVYKAL